MSDIDHTSNDLQTTLLNLVETYDWTLALTRVLSHPHEASSRGPRGRTALHIACDHDAPASLVHAILVAHPAAASMVGTSDMTPLHITCSSHRASVEVVRVLLRGSPSVDAETSRRDIDGDTPLHAACRCGAPIEVIEKLLRHNPSVVSDRDNEGLTPLLRLWVRYYVTLGEDTIEEIVRRGPIAFMRVPDLVEAWAKTIPLLRAAYLGSIVDDASRPFRIVHAAAAVDCPRAVLQMAIAMHPEQLDEKDEDGKLPLIIAATAPRYKVHDLSESGYNYDDLDGDWTGDVRKCLSGWDDDYEDGNYKDPNTLTRDDGTILRNPAVISVMLTTRPDLASVDDLVSGRLPLFVALDEPYGKCWVEGVQDIVKAHPDALGSVDPITRLHPFMLAGVNQGAKGCLQLNTVYELLKADPELVRGGITHDGCTNESKQDMHKRDVVRNRLVVNIAGFGRQLMGKTASEEEKEKTHDSTNDL